MNNNTKQHFHTIDALRFFAFFKVFMFHFPVVGDLPVYRFFTRNGGIGVEFFFVLSGFLITYILVFEKKQLGFLNLKRFFFRRALRIWPLFYFILGVAYIAPFLLDMLGIASSDAGYTPDWRYSFFFLENYKMIFTGSFPDISPLGVMWSLCIEEHFYIFWSVLLTIVPLKKLPYIFGVSIVIAILVRMIFFMQDIPTTELFSNLDLFAIGGILGYLTALDYKKASVIIQRVPNVVKTVVIILILGVVLVEADLFSGAFGQIIQPTVLAILFTIFIAIFIPADSKLRISSKCLNYLGLLSYGLYVYHTIFISVALIIFRKMNIVLDNALNIAAFVLLVFTVTVAASYVSYRFIEIPFLRLKNKVSFSKLRGLLQSR